MPYDAFPEYHRWLGVHEGGRVDHPKDPGGRTHLGVTQRVYDRWREGRGLPRRDVWSIEPEEAETIYRESYWNPPRCAAMWPGLDYAVFDYAVNSGVSQAVEALQAQLGVKADGVVGTITLSAIHAIPAGERAAFVERYCRDRLRFMEGLRHYETFKNGWRRRVMGEIDGVQHHDSGVIDRASRLARGLHVNAPTKREEGPGKAPPEMKRPTVADRAEQATPAADVAGGLGAGALVIKAGEVLTDPAKAQEWAGAYGVDPALIFGGALALVFGVIVLPRLLKRVDGAGK